MSHQHQQGNIITEKTFQHDTWNSCPDCGRAWKDPEPTHNIIHRVVLCWRCQQHKKLSEK